MPNVTVRYWAAAKEAAGLAEETISASTLSEALDAIRSVRSEDSRFAAIIARSSFLIDETPACKRDASNLALAQRAVIEDLAALPRRSSPSRRRNLKSITE